MNSLSLPRSSDSLDLRAVRRILFRTGRGLGDAVLCEPLVRAIIAGCPRAELTVQLPASCDGFARLGFTGDHFARWQESEPFFANLDGYDLVIDADPAEYAGEFLTATEEAAVIRLFAHYRPEAERTTAYERLAEGLARIGISTIDEVPTLSIPPGNEFHAVRLLNVVGARPDVPIIAMHPGSSAGYAFKRWSPEGFAFVANQFIQRYDANILLIGSGAECEQVQQILGLMPLRDRAIPVLDWPLFDLASVLDACDLVIGNDSGVGHLAAALGTPVVTVAGPTFAHFWGPLTHRAIVTDPEGCCYEPKSCGVRCMKSIRGEEVLGAAEALLTAVSHREKYACLDPISVADDLEVTAFGDDGLVVRSRAAQMPLTVSRGREHVVNFLSLVQQSRSAQHVRRHHPDGDILLEQCMRHGIVLPATKKENAPYA
ncbi:MAG TPA: glycosyltransferase family 9 protein [Capsulimonadaceae bacterium]|jgi:ADP-heptose:LPS heptosyltransferase